MAINTFPLGVLMKIALKALFLLQMLALILTDKGLSPVETGLLLFVLSLHIVRERLLDSPYLLYLELLIISAAVYYKMPFGLWYGVLAFDFAYREIYGGLLFLVAGTYILSLNTIVPTMPLLMGLGAAIAFALRTNEGQTSRYQQIIDEERSLRYSLEEAKRKLIKSQDEITHITEIKERNRIAREIHDHVGHSIAGILIQLQVAEQFLTRDSVKASKVLEKCVHKLSETLTTLRETVHNMRPTEKPGVEYIRTIIESYEYCPIDFTQSGDFSNLPPRFLETAVAILKEALTNTAKYSKATKAWVELDSTEKFLRIYYRDNGVGCPRIKEGLGLSGMRERVSNLGGNISISGENGFLIVCMLYHPGGVPH